MKIRDRLFEALVGLAVIATLGNLLAAGIHTAVFVDVEGKPLGTPSRIDCPRCGGSVSYILQYPVYECRNCGHRHQQGDASQSGSDSLVASGRVVVLPSRATPK